MDYLHPTYDAVSKSGADALELLRWPRYPPKCQLARPRLRLLRDSMTDLSPTVLSLLDDAARQRVVHRPEPAGGSIDFSY